ncbi:MAG: xanthine dehydrogenase family protein molybdopterin-binding subunit, partial [Planctomycetota bacterium]
MSKKKLRLGFEGKEKTVDVQVPDGTPDPWGTDAKLDVVGKDHTRVDGVLKVTGRAKYSYDVHPEAMIFAKLLRSPHAHARVVRVDLSRAKALKGVLYTEGQEGTVVHYPGQHVAGVAAETEEILDDALRLIHVEYEVLPHVVTVDAARAEGAPPVLERRNKNVFRERGRGDGDLDATEAAHKQADVVLERTYTTQIQTHSALETHGCVCEWKDGELTIWASTQGTFSVRDSMARALDVPQKKVRTITEHMGGGFGAKFGIRYWDRFCAKAAQMTGRPVRYLLDRKEEHLVGGNRPDSRQVCKFSAKKDGTLMGADVRSWGTAGTSARAAGVFNPGIYKFRATYKETYNVLTNTTEGRAFRAPRYPQGVFALEGMLDEIAEEIGMDPLELRKKNDPHPVRLAQYEIGAKQIGWARRNERPGSGKGPLKRGIGMASGLWYHTGRRGSAVRCRVDREGSVTLSNGAQDIGTGTRTILAVLGAEELGLRP